MLASSRTVPIPLFPTLPRVEYEGRYSRLRRAMENAGVDMLLLTERENVEYLSGYISSHWFMHGIIPGVVLFPLREPPCLLVPSFWLGTAQKKSWIEEILVHKNTHSNPDAFADFVLEVIQKRGLAGGVLGYEAGQEMTLGLPIQQFDRIREGLAKGQWVPAGEVLWSARSCKSPLEISLLRAAAESSCRALTAVHAEARIGMSELHIGRLIRQQQVMEGCEDRQFLNVRCGPPRYSMTDTLPEDRPIHSGEILILDVGMHRSGYWSDTARCASVGEPSPLYQEVFAVILEAQEAALAAISPGAPASGPYHAARRVIDQAGYGVHIDMMGHGIGMSMYEPPLLSPITPAILEEGMVLCVEPWITLPDEQGVLCLEETVVVCRGGYEKLTTWEKPDLWVIED